MRLLRYALSGPSLVLIGIVVSLGIQSIDRAARAGYAANSKYFLPLLPGIFARWILSGGHTGNEKVASAIRWIVDTGLCWSALMLLFWIFGKRAIRHP